jgi:hypothetical protein
MGWKTALRAAVLAGSLAAPTLTPAAAPGSGAAPAGAAASAPVPAGRIEALFGVTDVFGWLGDELLGVAFEKVLDATGLFEAIGLGNKEDEEQKQKLDDIINRLTALDQAIASLHGEVENLEKELQVELARTRIGEAQARFETCLDRLKDLARVQSEDPEIVARHNGALLARAYQVVGMPSPTGMTFSDDYCAILEPLTDVQRAVLPQDPNAARPMIVLARLARSTGRSFEEVVRYFAWVVGIQRQALAILAEAHHRLGEDALLAEVAGETQDSLRLQELELLHAAEAYALEATPFDAPAAVAALALADAAVGWMEGYPRLVTAGVLFEGDPGDTWSVLPTLFQGDLPALALDDLSTVGGEAYYGTPRSFPVEGHIYVQKRPQYGGVEVGWSDHLTIARYRTTAVSPAPDQVTLWAAAPDRARELALERRNAATLLPEATSGDPLADADRQLLAHPGGLASSVARFKVLLAADDPRYATLAVDEPAYGLADVPVGPIDEAGTAFAARPGVAASVLELVPRGPAEPERFALRLGDRWLGVVAPVPAGVGEPEPAARVAAVDAPVWFDLTRTGDAYELSALDDAAGVRRYLYVNAQAQVASDWQAATTRSASADLRAEGMLGVYGDAGGQTSSCTWVPGLVTAVQARKLSLDIHGGGDRAVTYRLDGQLAFSESLPWYSGHGSCSCAGRCTLTTTTGGTVPLVSWAAASNYFGTALEWNAVTSFPGSGDAQYYALNMAFERTLSPGQVESLRCEIDYTTGNCNICVTFTSLGVSAR